MAKAKVKLTDTTKEKVRVAAHLSGIQLTGKALIVGNEIHTDVTYRNAADLVAFGKYLSTVKGDEVDFDALVAPPAAEEKPAKTTKPGK